MALPAWLAVIEHMPRAAIVTVLPETVQTDVVVEAKLTAKPELAVAPIVKGAMPKATLLSAPNVIVCAAGLTVNPRITGAAAA